MDIDTYPSICEGCSHPASMATEAWEAEQMNDPEFRAAMVKIAMEIPEVQALVDALSGMVFAYKRELEARCLSTYDPERDMHISDARSALAPFEEAT